MTDSGADKVWVPDREEVWKLGEVIDMSGDGKTLTVEIEDTVLGTFMNKQVKREDIMSYDEDHDKDFDNAFDMGDLNEAAILALLKRRALDDKIYTFMGNILLSVNPYKTIPKLYEPMPEPGSLKSEAKDAAPHLYVLADRVAREMFEKGIRGTSQSVLINGESGAGKTVAAKQIMAFLADLSQHKRKEAEKKRGGGGRGYGRGGRPGYGGAARGRAPAGARQSAKNKKDPVGEPKDRKVSQVEETILRTNPLLEAFGNARTIRNDNSSRFGKFVQLNYSQKQVIIGARTRHFLLEKSRIVKHGKGERNYHIFYQFCAAFAEDPSNSLFKDAGQVLPFTEYSYLTPSKSVAVELEEDPRRKKKKKGVREGVSAMAKRAEQFLLNNAEAVRQQDLAEFKEVTNAFHGIDVDAEDQANVYRVLAAILALGNLHFKDVKVKGEDDPQCDIIDDKNQVQITADLLGVEKKLLLNALCKRTVRAGNRQSMTELALSSEEAVKSLDGLSKAIYEALFIWLVDKINVATGAAVKASAANDTKKKKERRSELFIGILDIFGFEILQDNSFEQLCINYANESLQGLFDDHVIKLEEQAYVEENVNIKLDYRDNKPLLNLLNAKGSGIFQLMDEQGALGSRGSDEGFLKSIHNVHGSKRGKDYRFGGADFETWTFEVNHFAGPVEYNALGMVGKNADHLQPDLADLIAIGGMPVEPQELSAEEKQKAEEASRMKKGRKSVASFGRSKQPVSPAEDDDDKPVENIKETFPFLQSILKKREKGLKKTVEEKPAATGAKSKRRRGKNRKMARLVSVSKRFRDQMKELEDLLTECDQHFVRCVKPNDKKKPPQESDGWDAAMVSQQLKMLGALEMVRARRNGYPVRSPFENVIARYPELLKVKEIELSDDMDARKACTALLNSYYEGGKNKLWALGDTKCFMREQVSKELDEKEQKIHTERLDREERAARRKREQERLAKQQEAILVLQRMVRGHLARQKVRSYRSAVVAIQAAYRMRKEKALYQKKKVVVVKMQAVVRGHLERKEYKRVKKLVPFQAHVRGMLTRSRYKAVIAQRKKYRHLLNDREVIVLKSSLAVDPKASARTTAGQPHCLLMTSGEEPRILFVNEKNLKQKAALEWNYNTICSLVQNEHTIIIRSEPSGPNLRKKWRFQFLLPVAIQWQLALHESYEIGDVIRLGCPDMNADVKAHGQVAPLDKQTGFFFGGPNVLGGVSQVYASGKMDVTQRLNWRHRFFVLKGTSLYWFEEKGKFAIGALTLNPLSTASVGRKVNAAFGTNMPANQGIEVTSPLLSSPLLLGCATQKKRVNWNRHIARAIKRRREDFGRRRTSVSKGVQNNKAFVVGEESIEAFDDRDFEVQIEQDEEIEQTYEG